jgi:hypothetical protein
VADHRTQASPASFDWMQRHVASVHVALGTTPRCSNRKGTAYFASSPRLIWGLSYKTKFSNELCISRWPLWLMKPNSRNLFMNVLTRDRVVSDNLGHRLLAVFGMTGSGFLSLPKLAISRRTLARYASATSVPIFAVNDTRIDLFDQSCALRFGCGQLLRRLFCGTIV